jgi:uncharacterized protein
MVAIPELNPFNFSKPAPAAELIDRDAELKLLVRLVEENVNGRLVAPRRYGKTTLLRRVREEVEAFGMNTVYVNLFGLLSVDEAADRIEDAYRRSLQGSLRNFVVGLIRTLHPTVAVPKTGVNVRPTLDTEIGRRLGSLLDLPVRIYEQTGTATLVVFDEFQDVLATKPPLDGLIRSRLEQHEAQASYIFAGSQVGMMSRLFDDRSRPFYGQARAIRLGPLPEPALALYVSERFERTDRRIDDVIELFLATVQGHPQRAMLVAYFLWESTARGAAADATAWERALAAVELEVKDEFDAIWNALSDPERRVVVAIARDEQLLRKSVLENLHLARSTARDARDRLFSGGYIAEIDDQLKVVDPLFGLWLARGRRHLVDAPDA